VGLPFNFEDILIYILTLKRQNKRLW